VSPVVMRIHSRAIICFDMVRRCGSVGQASRRLNVSTNSLRGRPAVHQPERQHG
jgi:hypothetical protein